MRSFPVITIDGPAASGKSTVSRELARKLGWKWVSTGAFYRGLAFYALRNNLALTNEEALKAAALSSGWRVVMEAEKTCVLIGEEDVTSQIEREEIGTAASQISRLPKVRQALLTPQRRCAEVGPGLIAEGRDCGTVVFPQAKLKVYLTASSEERALRRSQQMGDDVSQTLAVQKERDERDMSRKVAPLEIPDGALVIDTSLLSREGVVSEILQHAVAYPT